MEVLPEPVWRERAAAHAAAVDTLTAGRLQRRADGRKHPVEDFLFEYYNFRPAQLRRWHPGAGVVLEGAAERADWSFYEYADGLARVDVAGLVERRGSAIDFVRALLSATLSRPGRFGCFGLHEWAMVYRASEEQVRHGGWPLRLGAAGTDQVVEQATITCSHFDAYRFFTPDAAPLNRLEPTREEQVAMEQPGCLHAGMDVYKWCFKLTPLVPSDLTLEAFRLALEIRELDMRAAPYDLSELGYEPVRIETPEGRAEYAAAQRAFSARSNDLRRRLLDALTNLESLQRTGAPRHTVGMAYDERLAERIRQVLAGEPGVSEKKMFGGLAFLIDGNMAVAAGSDGALMFRRDPNREDPVGDHVRPQVMGERVMSGWLHVDAEGVATEEQLREIVGRGLSYAKTFPPK